MPSVKNKIGAATILEDVIKKMLYSDVFPRIQEKDINQLIDLLRPESPSELRQLIENFRTEIHPLKNFILQHQSLRERLLALDNPTLLENIDYLRASLLVEKQEAEIMGLQRKLFLRLGLKPPTQITSSALRQKMQRIRDIDKKLQNIYNRHRNSKRFNDRRNATEVLDEITIGILTSDKNTLRVPREYYDRLNDLIPVSYSEIVTAFREFWVKSVDSIIKLRGLHQLEHEPNPAGREILDAIDFHESVLMRFQRELFTKLGVKIPQRLRKRVRRRTRGPKKPIKIPKRPEKDKMPRRFPQRKRR